MDAPGSVGSFLGLILLGACFCSIGIFASSITTNQIIAFILAAFLCFLVYTGFDSLSALMNEGGQAIWLKQFGILYHYESISKGLIDSRDLVYFLSVTGLMIVLTKTVLGSRQWHG